MAAYSHSTYSARVFWEVDALRLIMDCANGMQEISVEKDVAVFYHSELEPWAFRHRAVYKNVHEGGQVRLKWLNDTTAEKAVSFKRWPASLDSHGE